MTVQTLGCLLKGKNIQDNHMGGNIFQIQIHK